VIHRYLCLLSTKMRMIQRHITRLSPMIRLMRLDKPIGIWLLLWPCLWGVVLSSSRWPSFSILFWFALGAVVMRSAGCIINDMIDRNIDKQVARTASRPLASGEISMKQACMLLAGLLAIGLFILTRLHANLLFWSPIALLLVGAYPFMKRITWWPQAFLGLTFNLGALFGWIAVHGYPALPAWILYAGAICWTIGYDTIYAHQDKADDLRVGVKSTAIRFGNDSRMWVTGFYALFITLLFGAGITSASGPLYYIGVALASAHLFWQAITVKLDDSASCLSRFRSNSWLGLILFAAILADRVSH
jgi:4-hydroxybenzoate polyprenyltransferase